MRRNEVDAGSQPVRNLFTNPQFENSNGTVTVQTNYLNNPSLEATGVNTQTVRINYHNGTVTPLGSGTTLTTGVSFAGYTWTRCTPAQAGYGARAMCNAADLISGNVYVAEWEFANENATSMIVQVDWCDGGFFSTTLAPGERKRVRTNSYSRVYDTVYRFTDAWSSTGEPFLFRQVLVEATAVQGPYFDGGTPVIQRTNLCHNPNLGATATGYAVNAGGGTATGAWQNAAGATGGNGFYRATWTAASTTQPYLEYSRSNNPEIIAAGRVYTFSGYVRCSAAVTVVAQIGWAASGAGNGGQVGSGVVLTPNTWTRVSLTTTAAPAGTTGAWFDWKVTSGIIPTGGTFDLDAVLVEESPILGTYFDGSSTATGLTYAWLGSANISYSTEVSNDFNYAWTGTANASTSYMRGTIVTGVGGMVNNRFAAISSTEWASSGTKSIRIVPLAPSDATINATYAETTVSGLTIGNTYYVRGVNRTTQALTGSLDANYRRLNFAGTVPSNVQHYTTPVNGANVFEYRGAFTATATAHPLRFYSGAPLGGGDVWWDELTVTDQPVTAYFDGSTAASGDFTYNWTGTANASSSQQKATKVATGAAAASAAAQSSLWSNSGTKSLRLIPTGTSTDTFFDPGFALQNKTYTLMATCRLEAPLSGTLRGAGESRALSVYHSGGVSRSTAAPNAVGVTNLRLTFKVTNSAAYQNMRLYNGASAGGGDVYWDNLMLVEGEYNGDFIDPSQNLLSKWDGVANASTSVGYSPQFLDIAGKPAAELIGLTGDTGNILAPDAYAARTLYVVYEHTDASIAWQAPLYAFRPSGGPAEGMVIQTSDVGAPYMYPRADFTGGTQNGTTVVPNGRKVGSRYVIAMSFPQGLASSLTSLSGATDVLRTYPDPAVGWASGRLYAVARAGIAHVRSMVFYAEHDFATRLAMQRYLGNKYGAAVA